MIRRAVMILFAAATSMAAPSAHAQKAAPACAAKAPLPQELAGWGAPHAPIKAAAKSTSAKAASLTLGAAVDATLLPTPAVKYVVQPAKPGGSVSFGGIFTFDIVEAGKYRVALDGRSWIDVVEGGVSLQSIAHGHGPDCSGVAKMVDFSLLPGRHLLQVSANGGPAISLMVTRLP